MEAAANKSRTYHWNWRILIAGYVLGVTEGREFSAAVKQRRMVSWKKALAARIFDSGSNIRLLFVPGICPV